MRDPAPRRAALATALAAAALGCAPARPAATTAAAATTPTAPTAPTATTAPAAPAATSAPAAGAGPVDLRLAQGSIAFHVVSPNAGSMTTVTVTPTGFARDAGAVTKEVDGAIAGVEIADLDGNGWPELYVFANTAGSGSYGSVIAWAVNGGKSMSEIALPELAPGSAAARGYMGHDTFGIAGRRLRRTFPVYRDKDPNCCPTGGRRTIEYALAPGEACWVLRPVATSDAP